MPQEKNEIAKIMLSWLGGLQNPGAMMLPCETSTLNTERG